MEADERADCGLGSDLKVLRASARVVLRSTVERLLSEGSAPRQHSSQSSYTVPVDEPLTVLCVFSVFSVFHYFSILKQTNKQLSLAREC